MISIMNISRGFQAAISDADFVDGFEAGVACDDGTVFEFAEAGFDGGSRFAEDFILAGANGFQVGGDAGGRDSEIGRAAREVRYVGAGDHRFRVRHPVRFGSRSLGRRLVLRACRRRG